MRKITAYNFITLNGFYKGRENDISWHTHGGEEGKFSEDNLKAGNILLFGRVTYELMAGFWPTPMAYESYPVVAEGMNKAEKIVFSKTLKKAEWKNTTIIKENIVEEIKKIKNSSGKNMTILGSGSVLTQFAEQKLIDEFQLMIDPVAIGSGTPIFHNIQSKLEFNLVESQKFKSGMMLLTYEPV